MHVELELSGNAGEALLGELTGPDGTAIAFTGRLGLLGALERLIAEQPPRPGEVGQIDAGGH
jgi:hypothetical protein